MTNDHPAAVLKFVLDDLIEFCEKSEELSRKIDEALTDSDCSEDEAKSTAPIIERA